MVQDVVADDENHVKFRDVRWPEYQRTSVARKRSRRQARPSSQSTWGWNRRLVGAIDELVTQACAIRRTWSLVRA